MDDPEDKLHLSNKLVTNCLNEHTALKGARLQTSPASWLKSIHCNCNKIKHGKRLTQHKRRETEKHLEILEIVLKRKSRTNFNFTVKHFRVSDLRRWNVIDRVIKPNSSKISAN